MSYYYRIQTKRLKLKIDTPVEVVNFLRDCFNGGIDHQWLPEHKLFTLQRWESLFLNVYGAYNPCFEEVNGRIFITLDTEVNYGHEEIHEFVKWITPYVVGHKPKEYIGWYKGENYEIQRTNLYIER